MPFPKIPRQLQEEIIFPRELKRFRYEEVTSLNDTGKRKICDIVMLFRKLATSSERSFWNLGTLVSN